MADYIGNAGSETGVRYILRVFTRGSRSRVYFTGELPDRLLFLLGDLTQSRETLFIDIACESIEAL
jgi:hypothetical protein